MSDFDFYRAERDTLREVVADLRGRLAATTEALTEAQEREQRVRALAARWKSIKGMSEIGRGIDAALDGDT